MTRAVHSGRVQVLFPLLDFQIASTTCLATAYLSGTGLAPLAGFTPGKITTVAGNGTSGYSGDGGLATSGGVE